MHLKHLELYGYKTFASRTGFVFDGGITAIVGPNGSGKSNIADALRWVLGEQSYRSLRGKRTEDMIFSGSAQRPRQGMASASLTFDNETGWLPIDFSEVTIARRAYRSGENEYLLNGQRVRLTDITELLSKSGLAQRTYTVVGQGVVDAVLSLHPEDRRALFEEAAGIAAYRSKRSEALARLEETRSNLVRVGDIVQEITPRLRRLEREAERADLLALLSQQLDGLLRTWYGYRWHRIQLDLRRARDAVAQREGRLERRRRALATLDERMAALRAEQSAVRERLAGWHRESNELGRQMDQVRRDLAVAQERSRLLHSQGDELEAELTELHRQARALTDQAHGAEEDLAAAQALCQERDAIVASMQREMELLEARRDELSRHLATAQARAVELAGQRVDRGGRLTQLEERRAALTEERREQEAAILALQRRLGDVGLRAERNRVEVERLRGLEEDLAADVGRLEASLAQALDDEASQRSALAEARLRLGQLQARQEAVARFREQGEGLSAGVRAILQAAAGRAGQGHVLSGIVGTVAGLIEVPAEVEAAIELALGGHVQDVVVDSQAHAEAAISFLRAGNRGRATFLPLDTLRPPPRLEVPAGRGVIGLAADLVRAPGRLSRVLDVLLGRTLLVQDLEAAREAFGRLQGGYQIVTLTGDLLKSSGAVTGGEGTTRDRGRVLAREREWRELPAQVQAGRGQVRGLEEALAAAEAAERLLREQRTSVSVQRRQVEEAAAQAREEGRELAREAERISQEVVWRQERVAQLEAESARLSDLGARLGAEAEQLAKAQQEVERSISNWQRELDEMGAPQYRALAEARTAAAVALGKREHCQKALDGLRERQGYLLSQIEMKRQRVASLRQEERQLADRVGALNSRAVVIQGWLDALAEQIGPAEATVAQLEAEREQWAKEESVARARLREAEASHAQAVLARSRLEDRRQRLRRQIMDDFGLVELELAEDMPDQLPLPLTEIVSTLPVVEALPEGLEADIQQLKAQIKRMGPVNPNARQEYREAKERHAFLTDQAADLEEAARRLREVVAELDEVMRREFHRTFEAVAARFEENFSRLFGGGMARLALTEPDDLASTGVEIIARPPGKRLQSLALLSGGERSLTAVALIFAFLQTSPPPFCVLDEVDAMLDEANVQRFRGMLEELAQQTQFIVITHNRTTIQAANTLYGVSMGEDSVSQVVSLRFDGDRVVAPGGGTLDLPQG